MRPLKIDFEPETKEQSAAFHLRNPAADVSRRLQLPRSIVEARPAVRLTLSEFSQGRGTL